MILCASVHLGIRVCLCECLFVFECVFVCVNVLVCVRLLLWVFVYDYVCERVCVCILMHMSACVDESVCAPRWACVFMCARVGVCTHDTISLLRKHSQHNYSWVVELYLYWRKYNRPIYVVYMQYMSYKRHALIRD